MNRKIFSAILIAVLSASAFISGMTALPVRAYGYDSGGIYPASVMHACDADPTSIEELQNVTLAFSQIYDMFSTKNIYTWDDQSSQWVFWHSTYGRLYSYMEGDPYDEDASSCTSLTTQSYIETDITDVESYHGHQQSCFLYVGHTSSYWDEENSLWRYGFYMHGKGQNVLNVPSITDATIHTIADDDHNFVFLWVCRCGHEIGGENNPANGMPYCWTNGRLPNDSSYCFIGFDGASPFLSEVQNGGDHIYKHWLVFFYYYALGMDCGFANPINDALDYASQQQGYDDFEHDRLSVVGPNYPIASGPSDPYADTHFPGILNPQNSSEWYPGLAPAYYDVKMQVIGNGEDSIPANMIYYP